MDNKLTMAILHKISNLPRIPCNLKVLFYSERIGDIEVEKVAIYSFKHEKEVEKAKDFEYCPHCITIYKSQYNELFKPLFENISLLNKEVNNLQTMI